MVNNYLDSNYPQSVSPQVHKRVTRKFRKLLLFIDRAARYHSSVIIRKHLEENKNAISINYLPKGFPDYKLLKKVGYKERKDDLLVSIHYPKFHHLKSAISNYYRIRCFILGVTKYLFRDVS